MDDLGVPLWKLPFIIISTSLTAGSQINAILDSMPMTCYVGHTDRSDRVSARQDWGNVKLANQSQMGGWSFALTGMDHLRTHLHMHFRNHSGSTFKGLGWEHNGGTEP